MVTPQQYLCHMGCPKTLVTDNGTKLSGRQFQQFAEEYDFRHIITPPHFLQANGAAERAVKLAKHILSRMINLLLFSVVEPHPSKQHDIVQPN